MNFRSYVGSTIANNAAILYGVLAVSARHRALTMNIEDKNSDEYERRCLEVLIPALNDTTKVLQDTALASAIILRLLEEMTGNAKHAFSRALYTDSCQNRLKSSL